MPTCPIELQAGWTPDKLLTWVGPEPRFKAAPQAKETNVYLQYIVSHYDKLPETMVFIHAHRCTCRTVMPVLDNVVSSAPPGAERHCKLTEEELYM